MGLQERIVIIRANKRPTFPEICPKCLKDADTTIEVRHNVQGRFGISRTKDRFDVPVCSECRRRLHNRAWLIIWPVSLGFVGLGVYLFTSFEGFLGWGGAIGAAILAMIARQYNPFGVSVLGAKEIWNWTFPTAEYATLFAEANETITREEAKAQIRS